MQASEIAATFRPWKRGREGDRRSSIRLSKQEQTTAAFTPPASSFPSPLFAILINSLQVFSQRDIADYFTRGCWPVQNRSRSPRLLPRHRSFFTFFFRGRNTRGRSRVRNYRRGQQRSRPREDSIGRGDFQSVH